MSDSKRLSILRGSLEKKEKSLDSRFKSHFDDVKSANGQPLNDKINSAATLSRWDKQSGAIRNQIESIEKTKAAIEREQMKISHVESVEIPEPIRKALDSGDLSQWRRHPNTFFVKGVDVGRIVWDTETKMLKHRYLMEIPKDQYPKFRDAFNGLRAAISKSNKP